MNTQANATTSTPLVDNWQIGFDAYCDGKPLEAMTTPDMRRGWRAALDAQAYAETNAYLIEQRSDRQAHEVDYEAELEDYREWILDNDYHRTGGW